MYPREKESSTGIHHLIETFGTPVLSSGINFLSLPRYGPRSLNHFGIFLIAGTGTTPLSSVKSCHALNLIILIL
jgi:hypothetical protein